MYHLTFFCGENISDVSRGWYSLARLFNCPPPLGPAVSLWRRLSPWSPSSPDLQPSYLCLECKDYTAHHIPFGLPEICTMWQTPPPPRPPPSLPLFPSFCLLWVWPFQSLHIKEMAEYLIVCAEFISVSTMSPGSSTQLQVEDFLDLLRLSSSPWQQTNSI